MNIELTSGDMRSRKHQQSAILVYTCWPCMPWSAGKTIFKMNTRKQTDLERKKALLVEKMVNAGLVLYNFFLCPYLGRKTDILACRCSIFSITHCTACTVMTIDDCYCALCLPNLMISFPNFPLFRVPSSPICSTIYAIRPSYSNSWTVTLIYAK